MANIRVIRVPVPLRESFKQKKPKIRDCYAYILENVFTEEECQEFIKETEAMGYEEAMVNVGGGRQILDRDYRRGARVIWDTEEKAGMIWDRIKPYIPEYFRNKKVMKLNERLRCLRYDSGDFFKPHMDGAYTDPEGNTTYITMQLYLNEGFEGGETTIFSSHSCHDPWPVVPKTGSVLLFQHDIWHEGSLLKKGRKYTIRSDVLYTAERFCEAQNEYLKSWLTPTAELPLPVCQIARIDEDDPIFFVVENALTDKECQKFIDAAETNGFKGATFKIGEEDRYDSAIRNSFRIDINDNEELVNLLWEKIKIFCPETYLGKKCLGLNDELIFLRYDPGGYFKTHTDEEVENDKGGRSKVTVQVYLNDDFEGGATNFMYKDEFKKAYEEEFFEVKPKKGCIAVFSHCLIHEGAELKKGTKYTVKADIMYSK